MCLTPITIKRSVAGRDYLNNVPCNHCLECIKDKQNEYIVRSIEESKKRSQMVFFTLTYSPKALPMVEGCEINEETGELQEGEFQSLRRRDVTMWLHTFKKKIERRTGEKLNFSHLICGEYGPRTMRPHYHGLIFGLDRDLVDEMMYDWKQKYGFVCFSFVPSLMADVEKVARYTSKYIVKHEDDAVIPAPWCEKPRKMTSHYYGLPEGERLVRMREYYQAQDIVRYDIRNPRFENKAQMQEVINNIIKRKKYRLGNGKEFKLPNYYKRQFFYVKDVQGKVRASALQRMVTYNVQCDFDKNFKEELHNLATMYEIRSYGEVVDRYNMVHDDDKLYRAKRYEENNQKYYRRSVY